MGPMSVAAWQKNYCSYLNNVITFSNWHDFASLIFAFYLLRDVQILLQ